LVKVEEKQQQNSNENEKRNIKPKQHEANRKTKDENCVKWFYGATK